MKATINLRAVNGYIEPRHFVRAVNDNITFTLDTALDCVFFLEWNGQVFSVADKQVTIPNSFIGDENTVVVRADTKRFNCGKIFTKPIDAEMVEMLDIESKYRQDIEKLIAENAKKNTEQENEIKALKEIISQIFGAINGLLETTDALENGKFKLMSFKTEENKK